MKKRGPVGKALIFNENEETTKIERITYLQVSYFKRIIIIPVFALVTAFFFLLFLFWYPRLRKKFMYSECSQVVKASHILVEGSCNYLTICVYTI